MEFFPNSLKFGKKNGLFGGDDPKVTVPAPRSGWGPGGEKDPMTCRPSASSPPISGSRSLWTDAGAAHLQGQKAGLLRFSP